MSLLHACGWFGGVALRMERRALGASDLRVLEDLLLADLAVEADMELTLAAITTPRGDV